MLPNSALERELREARDRCAWLEAQLQEYQQQLALESDRHRITAEELKARLYEMQTEADKNARLREEEQRQHVSARSPHYWFVFGFADDKTSFDLDGYGSCLLA